MYVRGVLSSLHTTVQSVGRALDSTKVEDLQLEHHGFILKVGLVWRVGYGSSHEKGQPVLLLMYGRTRACRINHYLNSTHGPLQTLVTIDQGVRLSLAFLGILSLITTMRYYEAQCFGR